MTKVTKLLSKISVLLIVFSASVFGQQKYKSATIAFYNLENLFDTEKSVGYIDGTLPYTDPNYHISISVDEIPNYDTVYFRGRYTYENLEGKKVIRPLILQEEFSPTGKKVWTKERYNQKLKNLSEVIAQLGRAETNAPPVIVGLCEVENREVIQDLIDQPALKNFDYGIAHFNSFDARGVDVGLIYQKSRFEVTNAKPYVVETFRDDGSRQYTRDILLVSGILDGEEEIHVLVNHWPSRSGGEKASMPKRIKAAEVMKQIFDEIREKNPNAKILAVGDFNDDPVSPSIKKVLGTEGKKEKVKNSDIYNPMESMFRRGMGTLAYRDSWNLFDQIIVTGTLVENNKKYDTYKLFKTDIFSPSYLITPEGQYKGYPFRMYGGDTYNSKGHSDHFPVYSVLIKEIQN